MNLKCLISSLRLAGSPRVARAIAVTDIRLEQLLQVQARVACSLQDGGIVVVDQVLGAQQFFVVGAEALGMVGRRFRWQAQRDQYFLAHFDAGSERLAEWPPLNYWVLVGVLVWIGVFQLDLG